MAKDPAFLFYTSDFMSGTVLMDNEQVGKYIRLLCIQHLKGHLSERDMLKICITHDEDIFCKFIKDENGLFYNVRMDEEITKRKAYSESRRSNRTKKDVKKTSKTYVPHMENENENIDLNINKDISIDMSSEIDKFSYMCMNDINSFVAPLTQKISNLGFQTELLPEYFIEFNNNLILSADTGKSYQDYRRHFINWITRKLQSTHALPESKNVDPNGTPIDRRKHPLFPSDYPYTPSNMYHFEHGKLENMKK